VDTAFVFDCLALPGLGTVPQDTPRHSTLSTLMGRSSVIKVMHDAREVRGPAVAGLTLDVLSLNCTIS
jgi:hypothetical protein